MFTRYFQQELEKLKHLGEAYSRAHPAIAPMLSGSSADPDVERLLEGVAFLTASLRQKLDDEFPEIIHEYMQLLFPHYLRPLPSCTILSFTPRPSLKESITVPAGTKLASVPVDGTPCLFQTSAAVELHPLILKGASLSEPAGGPLSIRLELELKGKRLADWQADRLRFFIGGDYATGATLYLLLRNHLRQVVLQPEGGTPRILPASSLRPVGLGASEGMLPYPAQAYPGYRILQEYFILPQRFLFFDLTGLDTWTDRGDASRLEIRFELEHPPLPVPRVRPEHFQLHATPAVNIFAHEADPIRVDHRIPEYPVRPAGGNSGHYQVYAVQSVVGFTHGSATQRDYVPFELFAGSTLDEPVYHTHLRPSPLEETLDVFLSLAYPRGSPPPATETLSVELLCSNGVLPESLQAGDISVHTSGSPEYAEFTNLLPPTAAVHPPLGTNLLWRLQSHLVLNRLSLASAANLRALLELYTFPATRDQAALRANLRRIAGIEELTARPGSRIVQGVMMRGSELTLRLSQDHFAGPGDLYLFGCILDEFLGNYASINSFTTLRALEVLKGEEYRWPTRIGNQLLI